eukprot:scaffold8459_cov121-Isochrysis_galbana.AAC.5
MEANPLQALDPAVQTVVFALVGLHLAALVRAALFSLFGPALHGRLTSNSRCAGILAHFCLLCPQPKGTPENALSSWSPAMPVRETAQGIVLFPGA